MSVYDFESARAHVGHKIECVIYGEQNVAIECIDCGCVLVDFEKTNECGFKQEWQGQFLCGISNTQCNDDNCLLQMILREATLKNNCLGGAHDLRRKEK